MVRERWGGARDTRCGCHHPALPSQLALFPSSLWGTATAPNAEEDIIRAPYLWEPPASAFPPEQWPARSLGEQIHLTGRWLRTPKIIIIKRTMKGLDITRAPVSRRSEVAPQRSGAPVAAQRRAGRARGRRPLGGTGPLGGASLSRRLSAVGRAAMFVRNGNAAVRARGFPKSNPKTGRRAVWAVNPFAYRQQCCFAASRAVGGRACCCSHVLGLVSVAQVYSRW